MRETLSQVSISKSLLDLLDETFETHFGIYLDNGTSLLETLAKIDYLKASKPIGVGCATLAAQVEHIVFYLEVLEKYALGEDVGNQNWGEIWERVNTVSDIEWKISKDKLKSTYKRVRKLVSEMEGGLTKKAFDGMLAIIVHTAYHLGEIRQALCWL